MLTPEQKAVIRRHVGDCPEDTELDAIFTRSETEHHVALEILEIRYANMEADAAKHSLGGQISEDWSANLTSLARRVAALRETVAALSDGDGDGIPDSVACAVVTGHITARS